MIEINCNTTCLTCNGSGMILINGYGDVCPRCEGDKGKVSVTLHKLKTLPPFFQLVIDGIKTHEFRYNDRDFKVNDVLELVEFDGKETTGNICYFVITYILDSKKFHHFPKDWVDLSIKRINKPTEIY